MPEIRAEQGGRPLRVAVAVSRYNETVTRGLLAGATGALREAGVADADVTVVHVPGALELPVTLSALARTRRYDALVALGAVIRGETDHYRLVCDEATRGCGQVALESGLPVGFGVLTCDTLALALERAGATPKNKGAEAARSAVETARLLDAVRAGPVARPAGVEGRASAVRTGTRARAHKPPPLPPPRELQEGA
jgi:6,7-dimethyl-8-ribityllumazine synthase